VPSYVAILAHPNSSDELFSIAAGLPDELIPRVLASALGDGEQRQVRGRALFGLAPRLAETEAVVAFEAARKLPKDDLYNARAPVMAVLLGRLPKALRRKAFRQVLDALANAPRTWDYINAVGNLAPHVSSRVRTRLLKRALERADAEERHTGAAMYAPLLQAVGSRDQESVVREALAKEDMVAQKASFYQPKNRADALAPLLVAADLPIQMELFSSWTTALLKITDDDERLNLVVRLLPQLKDDFQLTILQLMPELIKRAARPIVLLAVAGLAPTISRVSGEEGLRAVLGGVRTVATEFP
jgi:hypothetical protein